MTTSVFKKTVCLLLTLAIFENGPSAEANNFSVYESDYSIGPWSSALEEWTVGNEGRRQKRIMKLPPSQGYYITDRKDSPRPPNYDEWPKMTPPPPPSAGKIVNRPSAPRPSKPKPIPHVDHPQQQADQHTSSYQHQQGNYQQTDYPNQNYQTHQPIPISSYEQNQQIPAYQQHYEQIQQGSEPQVQKVPVPTYEHGQTPTPQSAYQQGQSDNTQKAGNEERYQNEKQSQQPGAKEVSETDLYLLTAIEKLVFRVDFMEKRLRKMEELMYYVMAGNNKKTEPCPGNYTRAGSNCYYFGHEDKYDWKTANLVCRKLKGNLVEMETIEENQDVITHMQANPNLRGKDYWTGGLNPGLLWIWSNSARPVNTGKKNDSQLINDASTLQENQADSILGKGRCLKLAYNIALRSYNYFGFDCSVRQNYICERADRSLSNEIDRISRDLKLREKQSVQATSPVE